MHDKSSATNAGHDCYKCATRLLQKRDTTATNAGHDCYKWRTFYGPGACSFFHLHGPHYRHLLTSSFSSPVSQSVSPAPQLPDLSNQAGGQAEGPLSQAFRCPIRFPSTGPTYVSPNCNHSRHPGPDAPPRRHAGALVFYGAVGKEVTYPYSR